MREWLEVLLKTLAIILVIGVIIGVGIHIFKQVTLGMKVCENKSGMAIYNFTGQEVNCTAWNEANMSAAQGQVDGKEKWSWLEHNLGWIVLIILLAVVTYVQFVGGLVA